MVVHFGHCGRGLGFIKEKGRGWLLGRTAEDGDGELTWGGLGLGW